MKKLTNTEFQEVYKNESFRNKVAFANPHSQLNGVFKYFGTCDYPKDKERQVTPEQIYTAQRLRETRAKEVLKENKNKLLFVCMGCEFEAKEGYINTHRMRTEFLNAKGKKYFIEVGTARDPKEMTIIHSIDKDLQNKFDARVNLYSDRIREEQKKERPNYSKITELRQNKTKYLEQPYNNFKGLERGQKKQYTFENLLNLVNDKFNCNFKEVVIDYKNINCDGLICESPKK